ncbi:hypothetical protein [Paenibacillus sinopodophylli]|uniref:hypothetical protein n=1 Tax=Paenibacillus sinopodophylli TaxID=1837342 RepID=UPI00110CF563|nr:hypothetical protein [Paenibacillus sinopodophylli]
MTEERSQQEKENELLSAYFMGDIREDIQYLGLTFTDIAWIIGNTLFGGGFLFLLPLPFWIKIPGLFLIFMFSILGRLFSWSYRRRRRFRYMRQKATGLGEEAEQLLGAESDGWFYRSGKRLHLVISIQAHPWHTAIFNQKKQRINGYEQFLRACASEGFEASLSAEQVADYQHELWAAKADKPAGSEGMAELKHNRITMWRNMAESGEAKRSVYVLRLSVMEYQIDSRERDDESDDMLKEERQRYRMVTELREKLQRVLDPLTASGHEVTILSGFSVPELIGRWWDPISWDRWMAAQGDWEQETDNPILDSLEKRKTTTEEKTVALADETTEETAEGEETVALPRRRMLAAIIAFLIASGRKVGLGLGWVARTCYRLLQRLKRRKQRVDVTDESQQLTNVSQANETLDEELPPKPTLMGILFFTSPTSTGKSFLTANMAVAHSGEQVTISVVDLSPDRGTHTYLNPLRITSNEPCWEAWTSRNAPGLTLWMPSAEERPDVEETIRMLRKLASKGPVLVDLPYAHPARVQLLAMGHAVAIVDADYHHWLQWEQAAASWEGSVWLNQCEDAMTGHMASVIHEKWGLRAALTFPYFPEASRWLFQGRPFVLDPKVVSHFIQAEEESAHDSSNKAAS